MDDAYVTEETDMITRFLSRLTRRVPLVEQELLTLPDHPDLS